MQANHGGVRGKLPKEAEDEEVMEGTADDSDEIMATPDDEVKEERHWNLKDLFVDNKFLSEI